MFRQNHMDCWCKWFINLIDYFSSILLIDDDIDDEEFYDDHLEAYFEQLAIPGLMYEDLEGQEPPENYFKLPTSDPSQVFSNLYGFLEIWHYKIITGLIRKL